MGTQESLQVVRDGFAAYGRGDIASLLSLMAEDVEWEIPGRDLPLAGTYRGRQGVAQFFEKLALENEIEDFQPREFLADGNRVVVLGWERAKVKATNRTVDLDWVMAFTVRDGKVASYHQYYDTKALAEAYESAARAAG